MRVCLGRGRAGADRIERGLDANPEEAPFLELLERSSAACAELSVEVNRCWLQAIRGGDWRAAAAWDERHRRGVVDDPVEHLDPEQVGKAVYDGFTQAQALAEVMRRFGALVVGVAETDGLEAARSRQGVLARQALEPEMEDQRGLGDMSARTTARS